MNVSAETQAKLERLMAAESQPFAELAKLCGLNPATDFRFRDLRGTDLSQQDLRAFDFADSDLSDADLTGSRFAEGALRNCRLAGAILSGIQIGSQRVRPEDLPDLAVFRDEDAAWCPEMVVIPGGTFVMGSPDGEPGGDEDEGPQHEVTVPRFALGVNAVTFAEYDHFCEATGRGKPDDLHLGRADRPVIDVSWENASAYCEWLSAETGAEYRLPSEAEWEYACRAGTTTPFWWGETITPEQANYDGRIAYNGGETGEYRRQTLPVRSFEPNPFGLYQMHGNVWEWAHDDWHDSYEGAPCDGSAWLGGSDRRKVLRGGSWSSNRQGLRSDSRDRINPDSRDDIVGFRVARTLTP